MLVHVLVAAPLVALYLGLAARHGVPGLGFRAQCLRLGTRLAVVPGKPWPIKSAIRIALFPMDSTRFFEFDFVQRSIAEVPATRYLDVSSPRLVPVMFALQRPALEVDLINPDVKDMAETHDVVHAAHLDRRAHLHGCLVTDAPFEPATFDLITCVSVLEHIPDDIEALRRMWALLKPGGTLVLTVPCMASACEQYIDQDEYGLLPAGPDGFRFWQRYYDAHQLETRIFNVLGRPASFSVYGERVAGSFARNAEQKRRRGAGYPFWREPYMMATEYRTFAALSDLPGEGVAGMVFVKR